MASELRLPVQRRSKESWARVLDAGVRILSEQGYEGFTIAAICERASVAPRFIYDRVDDKDTLFLAVYEHGLAEVSAEQEILLDSNRWSGLGPEELVAGAVHEVGERFRLHHDFLRSVVLISSSIAEVAVRGAQERQRFSDQFAQLLGGLHPLIQHADPELAIHLCFDLVFSSWVVRTAYGETFSSASMDDEAFDRHLKDVAVRYLLSPAN